MNTTVFPSLALSREQVHWENYLAKLTPWEFHQGIWFKREDYFAPLGYGGPNGSKMRQLIWLIDRARPGKTHILTGASVQSPQLSMSAIVGAHYGLPARQVVYSTPHTVLSHPNPFIASRFGAHFEYASGPYNPILQRHMEGLRREDSLVVEYGITLDHAKHDADSVRKFHELGAYQTQNMPSEVRQLIVPAGSCNSLTSILLGLSRDPGNLDTLFTLGIGPSKLEWVRERLNYIGINPDALPFNWEHTSLHDSGYASYSDKFNGEEFDGIRFHPTYEAKMWRWLRQGNPGIEVLQKREQVGFWIVGSAPDPRVVQPFFTHDEEAI